VGVDDSLQADSWLKLMHGFTVLQYQINLNQMISCNNCIKMTAP